MAQVAHADIGPEPVDLTDELEPGSYLAQVPYGARVLYATAETAPDDVDDWFTAAGGTFVAFTVGPGCPPTWARTPPIYDADDVVSVAVARR